MSEFFQDAETVKIEFPDGEWVAVKEELSQEDSDYIMSQMARAEQDGQNPKFALQLGQLPLLERSIVDWSFAVDGNKVPINTENISRLRVKYRSRILEEINRVNAQALEFVSKN